DVVAGKITRYRNGKAVEAASAGLDGDSRPERIAAQHRVKGPHLEPAAALGDFVPEYACPSAAISHDEVDIPVIVDVAQNQRSAASGHRTELPPPGAHVVEFSATVIPQEQVPIAILAPVSQRVADVVVPNLLRLREVSPGQITGHDQSVDDSQIEIAVVV